MTTVAETNGITALPGEETLLRRHHGETVYDANGFLSTISKKDRDLNRRIVNTYTGMWREERREETIQHRREQSQVMANAFYDIVTDFYEYGWGESFHFARTYKTDTFEQSIKRHEQYLAAKLGLNEKKFVLDVGCGVGGPLREIVRLSDAHITGLNNNAYQIEKCNAYSKKLGLEHKTRYIKGDFTDMPRDLDGRFDAAYAVEATVHSPKLETVYGEVFRALKPGGLFASYEWVTTPEFDENNPVHKSIIYGIEQGNSIPALSSYQQALDAAKSVGFEVLEYRDMAIMEDCHEPWYRDLKGSISLSGFRMSRIGRWTTHIFVSTLEFLRIAPPGSTDVSTFLCKTADALVEGGETQIFTPMFFILLRKPKED